MVHPTGTKRPYVAAALDSLFLDGNLEEGGHKAYHTALSTFLDSVNGGCFIYYRLFSALPSKNKTLLKGLVQSLGPVRQAICDL